MKRTGLLGGILAFFISACGQSGPLYLPKHPGEQKTPTPIAPIAAVDSTPA